MKNFLKIGNKKIGDKFKTFIICELGINHNGSLKLAKKMVDLAQQSGADAIKNQRHILDKEMIPAAKKIKPANAKVTIR
jgi:N-acetylneuraminate synthase